MKANYKLIIKSNELFIKKHKSYLTVFIVFSCVTKKFEPFAKIKNGPLNYYYTKYNDMRGLRVLAPHLSH